MATYYMDRNGSGTSGFGTLGGSTWNTSLSYWTNSPTGGAATLFAWNNTTNAADVASFGNAGATAVGGAITVSGTINAGGLRAENLSTTTFIGFNSGTIAFGANAASINSSNDIYIEDTCTLTGTNGFTKTGANALYLRGTATNVASLSGPLAHTEGTIGLQIFANNAVFFASGTSVALSAGTFLRVQPIFTDRRNVTVNGAFSGTGRVSLDNSSTTIGVGTVTFPGTLVGLTGYSASAPQGLYLYGTGVKAVTKDLPAQLTFAGNFANYGTTGTCDVNCTDVVAPTYSTKFSLFNDGAFDSDFFLRSIGTQAFTATGGIHRDNTSKLTNTIYFVLGGTNTGLNTISGTSTKLPAITADWYLRKSEAGTWVLGGDNSAFTATQLYGGTLRATNSNAFGGPITMDTGTALELAGGITVPNANTNAIGTIRNVSGNNAMSGDLTLAGALTVEAQADTLTLSGLITGSTSFTKTGTGVATLSNTANSFSSSPSISAGTLAVPAITALGTGTGLTLSGAGTLRYTGSIGANLSRTLTASSITGGFESTGTGSLAVTGSASAFSGTIKLGASNSASQYNTLSIPVAAGANGFLKEGSGRWIHTGGNNLSGSTAVNGGTLMAANAVGATTKLLGDNVTVAAGAKIQLGSDNGQAGRNRYKNLTFNGTSGNPARIRIGGSAINPTVQMSGDLTISGPVTWNLTADTFKTPGTYRLVEFLSGSLVGGQTTLDNNVIPGVVLPAGRTLGSLVYDGVSSPKIITVTVN